MYPTVVSLPQTPVTQSSFQKSNEVVRRHNRVTAVTALTNMGQTSQQVNRNSPQQGLVRWLPASGWTDSIHNPPNQWRWGCLVWRARDNRHGGIVSARWCSLMECVDEWVTQRTGGVIWFNKTGFQWGNYITMLCCCRDMKQLQKTRLKQSGAQSVCTTLKMQIVHPDNSMYTVYLT